MSRIYNLPKQPYKVVSIHRIGIENSIGICCDNCGATLVNHAIIKDQKEKSYTVGLDCLKTLTQAKDVVNQYDADIEVYSFNKALKFVSKFEKYKPTTFYKDEYRASFKYVNEKGKVVTETEFVYNFEKFSIKLPF